MKFREHRGSLVESMRTVVTVKSKQELIDHINSVHTGPHKIKDITFEHTVYDRRIDWDTWYVVAHFEQGDVGFITGMSDGSFDKPSNTTEDG